LKHDSAWLSNGKGKTIKIISALLPYLPPVNRYKIIFMQRNMTEILASQKKMLERAGQSPGVVSDAVLAGKFEDHIQKTIKWLAKQKNMDSISINYNEISNSFCIILFCLYLTIGII